MGLLQKVAGGVLKGAGEALTANGVAIRETKREQMRQVAQDARQKLQIQSTEKMAGATLDETSRHNAAMEDFASTTQTNTQDWRLKQGEYQEAQKVRDDAWKTLVEQGNQARDGATAAFRETEQTARIAAEKATKDWQKLLTQWNRDDKKDTQDWREKLDTARIAAEKATMDYRTKVLDQGVKDADATADYRLKALAAKGEISEKDKLAIAIEMSTLPDPDSLDGKGKLHVDKIPGNLEELNRYLAGNTAPAAAVALLKKDPSMKDQFIDKYGQAAYDAVMEK
jgi:hypothetical protein